MLELLREARSTLDFHRALAGDCLPTSPTPPDDERPDAMAPDLFGDLPDPSQDPNLSPYDRIEALIPEGSPLGEMDSLDEVFDWLKGTVLVPIDENRINPVLGTGDPEADQRRAADVRDRSIHLPIVILKDAQRSDLVGDPVRFFFRIAAHRANQRDKSGADRVPMHRSIGPRRGDARVRDSLNNGDH